MRTNQPRSILGARLRSAGLMLALLAWMGVGCSQRPPAPAAGKAQADDKQGSAVARADAEAAAAGPDALASATNDDPPTARDGAASAQRDPRVNQGGPRAKAGDTGAGDAAAGEGERLLRDAWDAIYLQGKKVGYTHTRVFEIEEEGRDLLRMDAESVMKIGRFNEEAEQRMTMRSFETPDGRMVRFETIVQQGPTPDRTVGRVEGENLILEITTAGKTSTARIPWSNDIGGFLAQEQELALRPMKPGDKRTLKVLFPVLNQVADVTLTAVDEEPVDVLVGKLDLQRIDGNVVLPGGFQIPSTMWVDRSGETIKTHTALMEQETFRTTKEVAMGELEAATFDLGLETLVRPNPPLKLAHNARRVKYRVTLQGGDPSEVFINCRTQQVEKVDDHTADVTVWADSLVRPTTNDRDHAAADAGRLPPMPAPADAAPTDADRDPNNLIQSDDATVVELADEAVGEEAGPSEVAAALETFVQGAITQKDYSTAFATAADVAQSRSGDCTEHSVLLAALLRAQGIPARVAMGLVYAPSEAAFAYHMWVEAFVNDRWTPLDGTLGRGGIGAAHLKLGQSTLAGANAYSSLLPVAQVLGRLKIEVLEEE